VGSRLHVFPPDADKDGAHQSDTRIYTFAFADVDRIRFHGSDENDYFENNTGIPCKASGKAGHDVLIGGWGDDELRGDDGQDTIHGGEGNDFISGGKGQDYLYGEAGDDEIYGGNHTDWIWGDFKSEYTPGAVDISSDQTRGGGDDEIDGGTARIGSRAGPEMTQ